MNMDQKSNSKIYQEDWYLLIVFIMMAVAILVGSYFEPNGYIDIDSAYFLESAQNLLEGKGYYVSAYANTGKDREFFAVWPIAYPTFIFLAAKLTGLSVFWASKFLSIVLIGIILGIFRVLFKHNAYVYGLIFFFAAYIRIFSYTWTETLFIPLLVWFSALIYFYYKSKKNHFLYFSIAVASLLLFMTRYIGAFSFGLIGLLGLYYGLVKKDRTKAMILIGIAIVNIGIMVLYLYHNYVEIGFPTGWERIPSSETNLELFYMLLKAMIAETLIPIYDMSPYQYGMSIKAIVIIFFVQFSIFSLLLYKYRNNILRTNDGIGQQDIALSFVFGSIGLMYLFLIILMRWISQFDDYGYRFLAPGSFLLFVGIIFFIQQRGTKQFFGTFKTFLLLFAVISYIIYVPYKNWKSSTLKPTYFQTIETLKEKYKDVEKNSIIVFASYHMIYLDTDIHTREPYFQPYYPNHEKWSEFMIRLDPYNNKNIYLEVPKKKLSIEKYGQSVADFVNKYDRGTLVKIQ